MKDAVLSNAIAAGELEARKQLRARSRTTRHAAAAQLAAYVDKRAEDDLRDLDERRTAIQDARRAAHQQNALDREKADDEADAAFAKDYVDEVVPLIRAVGEKGGRKEKLAVSRAMKKHMMLGVEQLPRGMGCDLVAAAFALALDRLDAIGDPRWIGDTDVGHRSKVSKLVDEIAGKPRVDAPVSEWQDIGAARADELVTTLEALIEDYCTHARHPNALRAQCLITSASTGRMVRLLEDAASTPEQKAKRDWEKRNAAFVPSGGVSK